MVSRRLSIKANAVMEQWRREHGHRDLIAVPSGVNHR